ncbi:unnamed protein product [Brassica rapa]|uniref:USP domain-containing protein n=2 Tax=Brassica TaxID=3705 RepID=A0A8D9DAE9_BRACM|nr:unnamed protein product [Brassica napus]CAG7873680.1 unnamed protein product [Brassica rapa]
MTTRARSRRKPRRNRYIDELSFHDRLNQRNTNQEKAKRVIRFISSLKRCSTLAILYLLLGFKLLEENRWYNFDDSNISHVNEDDVKSGAVYVLFYRRSL